MTQDDPRGLPEGGKGEGLSSLDERLKAARNAEAARKGKAAGKPRKGYNQGSRVLTELIAGPAGGAIIGWLIDRWLGTSPWLLLVMLFSGTVVAFRNIYRISNERPE
ncbi:AtpZ/AtpI family protein [Sphingomonas sp. PR090111-T3T-6A]|uniref:AtpZ/AtpI family protein n=1 Tax=Sphingomonas sp. PR090111-T3T-6A TaxID=685778 RepID=UPI000368297D|nr:AtpZ/AtpI family protein [Sphingomonas sp. PR090111-T3T-6A]